VKIKPGRSYPLGAAYDGSGTNFSLFAEAAEQVELALIAPDGSQECVALTEMDGFVWHGYLPGVGFGPASLLPGLRALRT
jgi:isoamylase